MTSIPPGGLRRVLIVDDHDMWRRGVRAMIDRRGGWEIVGEAVDGAEAVEKTSALAPDLVLLDIALPVMNGIEAARRMFERGLRSRILFMTGQLSWDVAEAALATGAHGYILKGDASVQLARAMDIVGGGGRFLSPRLGGRSLADDGTEVTRDDRCHEAVVYQDEDALIDDYFRFTEKALGEGYGVIITLLASRLQQVDARLREHGVDVDGPARAGRFVAVDVNDLFESWVVDGRLDEARVRSECVSLVLHTASAARREHPGVRAAGEISPTLLRNGHVEPAVRLEQIWDELCEMFNLDTLCGYLNDATVAEPSGPFRRVCESHSAVYFR